MIVEQWFTCDVCSLPRFQYQILSQLKQQMQLYFKIWYSLMLWDLTVSGWGGALQHACSAIGFWGWRERMCIIVHLSCHNLPFSLLHLHSQAGCQAAITDQFACQSCTCTSEYMLTSLPESQKEGIIDELSDHALVLAVNKKKKKHVYIHFQDVEPLEQNTCCLLNICLLICL